MLLTGFSTASIGSPSSINVESDNQFFSGYDGEVLVFEWSANNFDSGEIHVSADQISDQVEGMVQDDFVGTIENKQSTARYPLQSYRPQNSIRTVEMNSGTISWGSQLSMPDQDERREEYDRWARENCDDLTGDGNIRWAVTEYSEGYLPPQVFGEVYCTKFSSSVEANILEINTPEEVQEVEFSVLGERFTLSNSEIGEGQVKEVRNLARFEWRGGYETGFNFPRSDNELVAYSNRDGYYIVHQSNIDNAYSDYMQRIEYIDEFPKQVRDGVKTKKEAEQEIQNHIRNDILEEYTSSEFYTVGSNNPDQIFESEGFSAEDGIIQLKGDRMASFPAFTVFLKADEINYVIPSAEPVLEAVPNHIELEEGRNGVIQVEVGNTGDGTGNFEVGIASCTSGFTPSGLTQGISVNEGSAQTVNLGVTFSSDGDDTEVDGACTVEVQDLNNPSTVLTADVSLTGVQLQECSEGEQFTEINTAGQYEIWECVDGVNTEFVEQCGVDQIAQQVPRSDTYQCVDQDTPPPETSLGECELTLLESTFGDNLAVYHPSCFVQNTWTSITSIRGIIQMGALIAATIAGLYTTVMGYGLGRYTLPEAAGVTDTRIELASGLVGVLVGLMIAVFVYSLLTNIVIQIGFVITVILLVVTGAWKPLLSLAFQ